MATTKITPRNSAWYGWKPELPDYRDYAYEPQKVTTPVPASVNLNNQMGPVVDQGQLGSCTANALTGVVLFELIKLGKAKNDVADLLSRLFVYYNERAAEGTIKTDSGAEIRDGIKTLAKYGVCLESLLPYDITKFTKKPTAPEYKAALKDLISKYSTLTSHGQRIACLAAGFPFVAGFTVYSQFESDAAAKTGVITMPAKGDSVLGGHAIVVIGYDNAKGTYLCRNSWGTDWGMSGNFTIPFAYLDSTTLSDDHWVINA